MGGGRGYPRAPPPGPPPPPAPPPATTPSPHPPCLTRAVDEEDSPGRTACRTTAKAAAPLLVYQGRLIHVSFDSQDYSTGHSTPEGES